MPADPTGAEAWQPIETAPKDQRVLLLTTTQRRVEIGRWNDDKYSSKPCPYWVYDSAGGRIQVSRLNPPTHWMPLPKPPTGDSAHA